MNMMQKKKSISLYLHSSPVIDNILPSISLFSLPVHSVLRSVVLLKLLGFGDDLLTLLTIKHSLCDHLSFVRHS